MIWGGADIIIIEIKCTINVMCLNHPQTIPHEGCMEKLSSTSPFSGAKTVGDCCMTRNDMWKIYLFWKQKNMKIFINHSDRWIHQKRRLVYLLEVTRHSEQLHLACHKGNWPVEWMSKYWGIINIYMGFRESAGTQCHYFSFSLSHFPRILLFCNH